MNNVGSLAVELPEYDLRNAQAALLLKARSRSGHQRSPRDRGNLRRHLRLLSLLLQRPRIEGRALLDQLLQLAPLAVPELRKREPAVTTEVGLLERSGPEQVTETPLFALVQATDEVRTQAEDARHLLLGRLQVRELDGAEALPALQQVNVHVSPSLVVRRS
jgi:hypothetical protein